ncbi:hypothetical protein TTHERM_00420960 (macronuclear) [Tetrahymena thermophila SB210]|uniref:Uncharacterized protein n=1 Tax=Tetrahymena thermophila (strain SB210) TaxID=312017 RepID=I7M6R5_TETTS|nr:hypothetical protein TTHERM_00420960 [Tetrahymena thermophila SB210]EAR85688.2 hypothetical protein TTHERM_00420960 [Tetrahymena thermophila SB210]|eukprot:XP_001033351.2 hypothetical protein TTHERM_00420960 [Tetrahymena thermophila SB210]
MSEIKGQSAPFTPQAESQQTYAQNSQSPFQYDWVDVVRQQNSRLIQNEERQKQLQQIRKQKYREILEQEINEKEVKKNIVKDIKKQEYEEIEKNISIVDKYDQEKKIQKRLIERQIQEQNKQLTQEKKQNEKQVKNLQIEQTQNSYSINNLNIQKQAQDEIQQKIQRQKDFLKELENQKKQNQAIKDAQKMNLQQEDRIFVDQLASQDHQQKDNYRNGFFESKPNVFQQIDQAYREKEQKIIDFENHHVKQGYQQQIEKEKKMQDLIKQEKKQLQNQVDSIVNNQLQYKKQVQVYNNNNKNEERSQIDQNYMNFKNAEIQRKNNQRELYARQNVINQQQQQLKSQIKERQKHMNENEIKINIDKLPESPIIPQSATNFTQERSSNQPNQTKSNLIYMGDYVSFDRQKQLQQVDKDLLEKQPAQQELYKRTVINKSMNSLPQLNDSLQYNQFPKTLSPDSYQNQQISNRSNNKNSYDLYLQQTKFPKNHAFTSNKSPPLLTNTLPHYQNNYPPKNIDNSQQFSQTLDYNQNYRQSSSPQLKYQPNQQYQIETKNIQPNLQYPSQNNQQENQFVSQNKDQNKNMEDQIEKLQQSQQQQQYLQNKQIQSQIKNLDQNSSNYQPNINSNANNRVQSQSQMKQAMSPNNYYQNFNYNVQSNSNLNSQPLHSQSTHQQVVQVPISNTANQIPNSRSNKKEFNIKSIQYNAPINDQIPKTTNNYASSDNLIRVYRSPQNMQLSSNNQQQNYHIPQQTRNQNISNSSLNQPTYSNHRSGTNTGMSNSMNFIDHRSNILSSQRQDYNQIRQSNANWAQRGFNIITGAT